jgi:hypothetical protein
MNKKILLAMIALTLLSCNFLFPLQATPLPELKSASVQETASPGPLEETTIPKTEIVAVPASDSFFSVRLHPEDGDLTALLAGEAQKAVALGQMPVVEFSTGQSSDKHVKSP